MVVNISKLIPHYCFYSESGSGSSPLSQADFFTFSNFIPSDKEVADWVGEQIKNHFEGYKELPPSLPFVQLDNVRFDDRGILEGDKYQQPMTLFNAFFSTNMFY
jgi:hypothetical protein